MQVYLGEISQVLSLPTTILEGKELERSRQRKRHYGSSGGLCKVSKTGLAKRRRSEQGSSVVRKMVLVSGNNLNLTALLRRRSVIYLS